jgi:hypothetical protein
MHFTPAVMMQAEDRAHRIGQEHNCVNVHYLYGSETIDEMIFPKLKEKFGVVTSALDNKRMDMNVEKIRSGCVGDINLSIGSTQKILNIARPSSPKSGKKMTIKDFFLAKNTRNTQTVAKESKQVEPPKDDTIDLNDDEVNNILTMIQEEEIGHDSTLLAVGDVNYTDINLHESLCKRKSSFEDINDIDSIISSNSSGKRKIS